MRRDNSLAGEPGDAVDVDGEDPGFTVVAPGLEACGARIWDEELALIEDFLPDLLQEMLRQLETDTEGERT